MPSLEFTTFSFRDLELWPMTLTFKTGIESVEMNQHTNTYSRSRVI